MWCVCNVYEWVRVCLFRFHYLIFPHESPRVYTGSKTVNAQIMTVQIRVYATPLPQLWGIGSYSDLLSTYFDINKLIVGNHISIIDLLMLWALNRLSGVLLGVNYFDVTFFVSFFISYNFYFFHYFSLFFPLFFRTSTRIMGHFDQKLF